MKCIGVTSDEVDACDHFEIVPRRSETDHDIYRGSVVLKMPLDYRRRQIYRLPLAVNDGNFTVEGELVRFLISNKGSFIKDVMRL